MVDVVRSLLADEFRHKRPGAAIIVERLADIFLVQVVRAHFDRVGGQRGLLAAVFDPRLAPAVALMHSRWNDPPTLAEVAAAAGMSRSSFAEHFRAVTGLAPMAHLANWRLLKSRELLADRTRTIAEVARACGHRSTEGFSRAFKRAYGVSPARWRSVAASAGPS